ncbi:MAG TPA: molybdopterin cofactor-binding domain-containing protein [Kofleriaceae bacterium]|jgi:isoquinoline 1-oxidoreductase beta subunit|nr:molybdopterin cofactor-binding domain-containing protein [Kofleriaceae bacterium]
MTALDRRGFLQVVASATGGLMLAAHLPGLGRAYAAAAAPAPTPPTLFIRIDPDNRITLKINKSELGQGVRTSLALLIAEELEADWPAVQVETASLDPRYGDQGTGGSGSVWPAFEPLRRIGAAMRTMLVAAAAARWKLPAAQLRCEDSHVLGPGGRRASYGELAADAARQPVPAAPPLKPRSAWKLIGKDHVGKDVADIVHGRARYGLDQRPPGLLFASIERPAEFGATLDGVDASAALAVPGVRQVFPIAASPPGAPTFTGPITGGVAVVASNTWAALEGRRRLRVRWRSGPHAAESTTAYRREMAAALDRAGAQPVLQTGDPDAELAKAARIVRAEYELPFLAHATMEPMNCTAHWDGRRMTLWSPSQDPEEAGKAVAARLGLAADQVAVHVPLIGGGFGRRLNTDYSVEAALVAREVGAPVQVMWTREDDLGHDFYRPCARHRLEACLDDAGHPRALRHRLCNPAIGATYHPERTRFDGETGCVANAFYRVPHRKSEYALLRSGVPRGWWRAVTSTHGVFAIESFVDELAEAAGQDPLAYRLALIDQPPPLGKPGPEDAVFVPQRMKDCLALAAERAGWGRAVPAGHGLGLACGGFDHRSYAAAVVEASADAGRVTVHRVVVAFDCATVVHPDGARAQVEGAVTQALSTALHEQITIDGGRPVETNFHAYSLLRMHEAPARIEVHFIDRPDAQISGLGESALPPVAPALANALYRATGHRLRELPLPLRLPA